MSRTHRVTPTFRYPTAPVRRHTVNVVPWLVRGALLAAVLVLSRLLGVSP